MKRASNTFSLAELAALLRVASAADRRDVDAAERYAQTPAALTARRKLQAMRDRIVGPAPEPKPEEVPPPQKYVSRAALERRARKAGTA